VKVLDFGIAKFTAKEGGAARTAALTSDGVLLGTPYYMAPEQISGRPASPLMDVYSWGMLLFELLTGRRGVTSGTMESVYYQILNQPLDEPAMEQAGVPAAIRKLVMETTAKDPRARPQNFGIVIRRLRRFLNAPEAGQAAAASSAPLLSAAPAAPPGPGQAPARVPQSPAGPIIRLSVIVYASVAVTTVLAIVTWMGRPAASNKSSGQSSSTAYVKAMAQGMVYVPAGTFLAGADKHPVMLNAFLIDTTEVTAGDYCDLMPCAKPQAESDLPIVNISIAQARHYAMRVGKRLPTPLEWERAARGVNGNLYPWGDAEDPTLANVADNSSFGGRQLVPVKSFQAYPEYQMVGNAWEFVEGVVTPSDEAVRRFASLGKLSPPPTASESWVSVRGGSYAQPLAPNIVYDSLSIPERFTAPDIGFRCVKDP
jgi:formylglycine-generating enzyme required for sulfatase activity